MHFTVPTQPLSPLARRPKIGPTSPNSINIDSDSDDFDELSADVEHNAGRSQSRFQTQATQIVDRPTLGASPKHLPSSPPSTSSAVEVPASSPFQQPSRPALNGRLGSAMAPRGTSFKPPPRATPTAFRTNQVLGKRPSPATDVIDLTSSDLSDNEGPVVVYSSGDERPSRGDIRPTSFHRRDVTEVAAAPFSPSSAGPSSPAEDPAPIALPAKGSVAEKRLTRLIHIGPTCLSKLVTGRSSEDYQRALLACNYNKDLAAEHLRSTQAKKKPRQDAPRPPVAKKNAGDIRNFIRSFEHKAPGTKPTPARTTEPDSDPESTIVATPAPKPKGRLRRGLKPRDSPQSRDPPSPTNPEAISILDSSEDEFSSASPSPVDFSAREGKEKRILNYLNECTLNGLLAISGNSKYKKDYADIVISRRPFASLAAVKRITLSAKSRGASKRSLRAEMANAGEQIIDSVSSYIKALDAIDDVVAKCDAEGTRIKSITDRWNMDSKGDARDNGVATGLERGADGQLTPSSMDGHSVELPIAREPEYMRGHCSMKQYQLYGLNWLYQLYFHRFGCILADDMGLGKTCQVISLISHIVESYSGGGASDEPRPWPNLIVVPPSTFSNWQTEFERFAPDVKVTLYHGKPSDRDYLAREIRDNPSDHHVVLTTYTQLGRYEDVSALSNIRPNAAVFDEGHKVKNSKTNIFKGLNSIKAQWRLLLTGTPIQNNIMEMINLLSFIQPALFQTKVEMLKDVFDQKVTLQEVSNGALLFSDRIHRARSILEPFILQRQKEQVLSALPAKTSRIVYCEMDVAQRKIYDSYRLKFRKDKHTKEALAQASSASESNTKDKNNVWIQLRKSAIHSQLFRRYFTDAKVEEMAEIMMRKVPQTRLQQPHLHHLVAELQRASDFELHLWCRDEPCISSYDVEPESWMRSGKVQALLELLREFRRNGDRALVFTRFATMIEIMSEALSSADIPFLSLQGSTKVEERQDLIDEFNEAGADELTAFLLTTGAGGTGINLASANKVIIFDQSDNPQDDAQAESRAHRLGQTRDVEVIRLITRDSVEELIYRACQKKLELAEKVTGVPLVSGDQVAREVEEEVRQMLAEGESGGA